jgi:uracil-DNA glycosylase family 4
MTNPTGSRRLAYLEAMGIQAWSLRSRPAAVPADEASAGVAAAVPAEEAEVPPAEPPGVVEPVAEIPQRPDVARLDWDELQAQVAGCTLCELHSSRTQTVFGVGNRAADWLVIGEAPGKDEDQQGEPFVGRAGQLLNAMLQAIGLKREQVYIANILKCRPPNNRDPKPEEVVCCEPYLLRQIALIKPGIILAVGRISAQNLLQTDTPIGKLRGRVHRFRDTGIPLVATYHPAYLLRSPVEKRKAWQDLQLAVRTLQESAS